MANTTETNTSLPSYIEKPTKTALTDVQDWLKSDKNYVYGSKKGENLTTDLSKYQKDAMGNVGWLASQDLGKMFGLDKAGALWDKYASSGAQTISGNYDAGSVDDPRDVGTERLVDENGWLGKISDYTNPYTQATLDPVLRELRQEDQRQKNNIGAIATQSGAFGDARHGIMEGEQSSRTNEAIADSTSRAYSDAYNAAMAQRSSDIGRKGELDVGNVNRDLEAALANMQSRNNTQDRLLNRDTINRAANEAAIERLGTAATATEGLGDNLYKKFTGVNDALYNAGSIAQQNEEKKRAAKEAYVKAINEKRYNDAIKLLSVAQGSPQGKEQTTSESSDDGKWGTIGSVIGGLFG